MLKFVAIKHNNRSSAGTKAVNYVKSTGILKKLTKLFSIREILYYLCTRFGGRRVRGWAFEHTYGKEVWDLLDKTHSREIVKVVEKYARKGRILDLGCGTGTLVSELNPNSFGAYLGIDISPAAINMAQKRKSQKIDFEVGDIESYQCKDTFDLIVFEESLYYVPFFRRRLLRRYARYLRPGGLFAVTIAHPDRFRGMIRMVRRNFQMVEDRFAPGGRRLYLVFR
jgi:SAM-dependent methyltransferase